MGLDVAGGLWVPHRGRLARVIRARGLGLRRPIDFVQSTNPDPIRAGRIESPDAS